jgi:hypothetical protein
MYKKENYKNEPASEIQWTVQTNQNKAKPETMHATKPSPSTS